MGVTVTNAISAALLPPFNLILLCALGLLLRRKWPRIGLALSVLALVLLVVISTRAGARLLIWPLEQKTAVLASPRDTGAQAIVVLGGGRIKDAAEYGGKDLPDHIVLARLRYAARLQRETGLSLLVSGGTPQGSGESEAAMMARVLQEDFGAVARWQEDASRNTAENARFSASILQQEGFRKILLVTDGMHMPRAQEIFERSGFDVVAAPTALLSRGPLQPLDFIPSGEGMRRSHYAMHEWLGLAWYRWRYDDVAEQAGWQQKPAAPSDAPSDASSDAKQESKGQ